MLLFPEYSTIDSMERSPEPVRDRTHGRLPEQPSLRASEEESVVKPTSAGDWASDWTTQIEIDFFPTARTDDADVE